MMRATLGVTGLFLTLFSSAVLAQENAPSRVVSMNLCTDQLAMLLAGPEQLLSVSYLAQDPRASAMAEEALAFHINRGLAEEIYLLDPDLVIAGAFSTKATVAMLKRLGIPVVVFDPAYSLKDVRERIMQMGTVLDRVPEAQSIVADFDARLDAFSSQAEADPSAVLYYANGYTSGDKSLAGQILVAAGFANVAAQAGYATGGRLPLEVLAMTDPDMVIMARPYQGASRSEAILDHPVVQSLRDKSGSATLTDHDWVCGTPYVLRAIESLAGARKELFGDDR